MNLVIERNALLSAITKVATIVARKSTIPIISNILLEADGLVLTIRATNLEIEATVSTHAEVSQSGSICVPADALLNIAKNASEGAEISLTLEDRLIVKSGRSRFKLATLPAIDFPTFAELVKPTELTMTTAQLQSLVGRTAFAVSKDASRFFITGVRLFSDGKTLGSVSTDGKRMAVYENVISGKGVECTIPAPFVNEIGRMTGGDAVTARVTAEKLQIVAPDLTITGKLIDMDYAVWRRVIPTDLPNVATVDCDELLTALRRVQLAIEDESHSCRLVFGDGVIRTSARTSEADAADEVEANYDGPETELGVNSAHMIEALSALNADVAEIAFKDKGYGMIVRSATSGDFINVIMPLKS